MLSELTRNPSREVLFQKCKSSRINFSPVRDKGGTRRAASRVPCRPFRCRGVVLLVYSNKPYLTAPVIVAGCAHYVARTPP